MWGTIWHLKYVVVYAWPSKPGDRYTITKRTLYQGSPKTVCTAEHPVEKQSILTFFSSDTNRTGTLGCHWKANYGALRSPFRHRFDAEDCSNSFQSTKNKGCANSNISTQIKFESNSVEQWPKIPMSNHISNTKAFVWNAQKRKRRKLT